jgi:hypothetical protein
MTQHHGCFPPCFVLAVLGLAPMLASAKGPERVFSCALHPAVSAHIYRSHPMVDTYVYSMSTQDGVKRPILGNEEASRGMNVRFECLGRAERVLILSGEFSSNYTQGFVLRYNKKHSRWDRLDFSERERPAHVFVSDGGVSVAMPNSPADAVPRYVVYSLSSSKGRGVRREITGLLPSGGQRYDIPQ